VYRVLSLVDNVSHVSPALEADFKMTCERVCEVWDRAIAAHRLPKTIRLDNGPDFAGKALGAWAYRRGVTLCFSRTGKLTETPIYESFNVKLRILSIVDEFTRECLALEVSTHINSNTVRTVLRRLCTNSGNRLNRQFYKCVGWS
jgi:transposase InsO family protein